MIVLAVWQTTKTDWEKHCLEQLTKSIFFFKDTSRNLRQVDQMLGQYREYSNGQAGAIEHVRMFPFLYFLLPTFLEMQSWGVGMWDKRNNHCE